MGFEEFLSQNQVWDWVWQLFKGISPLLVALITILLNNRREKKRNEAAENKQKNESIYNELKSDVNEIEKRVLVIHKYVWLTGKELLQAIQHCDVDAGATEGEVDHLHKYAKCNEEMLEAARELTGYADIKAALHSHKELAFLPLFEKISNYSNALFDILDWYNDTATKTPKAKWDDLLDEVQAKMITASQVVENELVKYCISLGDLLKNTEYGKYIKL